MESIAGYDTYKTASPEEYVNQDVIDIMERSLLHCPFCLAQPFFEDSADSTDIYVTCNCGVRMRGADYNDVAERWSRRPVLPVAKNVVRSISKEFWTGY